MDLSPLLLELQIERQGGFDEPGTGKVVRQQALVFGSARFKAAVVLPLERADRRVVTAFALGQFEKRAEIRGLLIVHSFSMHLLW